MGRKCRYFRIYSKKMDIYFETDKRTTTVSLNEPLCNITDIAVKLLGDSMFVVLSVISIWFEKRK